MSSTDLHEAPDDLSPEAREMHRAVVSLMEELEAVDWYGQRVDATRDDELKRVLEHNRDEEKEHACMMLEWIRRRDSGFDRFLRQFLFKSGSVVEFEGHDEEDRGERFGSLAIGSLKRTIDQNEKETS